MSTTGGSQSVTSLSRAESAPLPVEIGMSKAQCALCNDIIESKHQHDFVEGARDMNNVIFTNFIIDESREERL